LKIVLDGRPTQPGYRAHLGRGIGHYTQKLIEYLPALGSKDTFLILQDANRDFNVRSCRENLRSLGYRAAGWIPAKYEILRNQMVLPWVLRSAKADLVHFFCHEDAPLLSPVDMIVTIHDLVAQALPQLYKPKENLAWKFKMELVRKIAHQAKYIITSSESSKKDVVCYLGVSEHKIEVIYAGVESSFCPVFDPQQLNEVRERYNIPEEFLLYLGGIDPRKNIFNLLEAFRALLLCGYRHLSLVIAGAIEHQIEYPQLLRWLKELELEHKVRLIGFVSQQDLPALFSLARVFLFPSLYEGFGLPPLEAMACGTPLVTSSNSSLAEVVGDAGVYVDPHSPEDIAGGIKILLSQPELRKSLQQKGIKRAKLFSWEKTAQKILRAYHEFEKNH